MGFSRYKIFIHWISYCRFEDFLNGDVRVDPSTPHDGGGVDGCSCDSGEDGFEVGECTEAGMGIMLSEEMTIVGEPWSLGSEVLEAADDVDRLFLL